MKNSGMFSRRHKCSFKKLAVLMIFIMPITVYANSAPIYMSKYPSFEISPMQDCPVIVEKESLRFKIDERSSSEAVVTATYTLYNPLEEKLLVPMIFPFVSEGHYGFGAEIEFNGKSVEHEIYNGGAVGVKDYLKEPGRFKDEVDINRIIDYINEPLYEAKLFDDTAKATLYTVTTHGPIDRQCNVSFNIDGSKTRAVTFGFNGFQSNEQGDYTVSRFVNQNDIGKESSILVLGEDTLSELSLSHGDTIEKSTVVIKDYLENYYTDNESQWIDPRIRNTKVYYAMVVKGIDHYYSTSQYVFSYDMVVENMWHQNNIYALLYEVELEGKSTSNLSVTYTMMATIDREKSEDFVNTFAYIINPAKNFADFRGMEVQIELNSKAPYIINSSIPLNEINKGLYGISLESLPQTDLVFSTYSKEKISFVERAVESTLPKDYGRFLLGIGALIFLLVIILIALYRKKKNASKLKDRP